MTTQLDIFYFNSHSWVPDTSWKGSHYAILNHSALGRKRAKLAGQMGKKKKNNNLVGGRVIPSLYFNLIRDFKDGTQTLNPKSMAIHETESCCRTERYFSCSLFIVVYEVDL